MNDYTIWIYSFNDETELCDWFEPIPEEEIE